MPTERDDPEPRQMIYDIRRRVQVARNRYWAEGVDGEITDDTHRELATAVLQYHDVLYEFRDESILGPGDFPDLADLRERVGKQARHQQPQAGLSRPTTVTLVPAVTQVPIEDILEYSEQLDDLAKTLGFGAKADERTDVFGVDPTYDGGDNDDSTAD